MKCTACGSLSFAETPDSGELGKVYDESWQSSDDLSSLATGSTDALIGNSLLDAFQWRPIPDAVCLDNGAGHGHFTKTLIERGCQHVYAFEPYGTKPNWLDMDWIRDADKLPTQKFDWVFLIEVVEHMLDPVAELQRIRTLLAPGGQLVLTTPNASGIRARLQKFEWREAQNPTHINLFSPSSLEICLRRAGFTETSRNFQPVRYLAKGLQAQILYLLQRIGMDGGLRYIARNS
ncbi:MAG: class I SAM-dependent methyltransferase [Woeseia sp.]